MTKDDLILRLQHFLSALGYGCKCVNFTTNPDCPLHFTKGISLSEEKIIESLSPHPKERGGQ